MAQAKKTIMITLRGVFLALMIWCLVSGRPELFVEFMIPFLVTLPIPFMGRTDEDYYLVDSGFSILFTVAGLVSYFTAWPATYNAFSIDKFFHFSGGLCLAGWGFVFYRRRLNEKWVLAATVFFFMLAVGGGWEVFEWFLSLLPANLRIPDTGYTDTMMDLVADSLGSVALLIGVWAFGGFKKK